MEPVEINAGTVYLRQFRADRQLDDRTLLVDSFADPLFRRYTPQLRIDDHRQAGQYITERARNWIADERCSWAIAEPATGALLGEVGLKNLDLAGKSAEISIWVHPDARGGGIAVTAVDSAVRFGFGALGLTRIVYRHAKSNTGSETVAKRCGFTYVAEVNTELAEPDLLWVKEFS